MTNKTISGTTDYAVAPDKFKYSTSATYNHLNPKNYISKILLFKKDLKLLKTPPLIRFKKWEDICNLSESREVKCCFTIFKCPAATNNGNNYLSENLSKVLSSYQ